MQSKKTVYEIKELVKQKYASIAKATEADAGKCNPAAKGYTDIASQLMIDKDYQNLPGYMPEADLGLGCGLPTRYAGINSGDTVVDLGAGAGNDCFIARSLVGKSGKVIGIDFTKEMIEKARINAEKMGFDNIQFKVGDLENIPIASRQVDVVISNCTLNLINNKKKVFKEIFRILKLGGHFCVADIVLQGNLTKGLIESMEAYTGCIAGAIQKKDYLKLIHYMDFGNITVQSEQKIDIPEHIMATHRQEKERYSHAGIISITVRGEKPIPSHRK